MFFPNLCKQHRHLHRHRSSSSSSAATATTTTTSTPSSSGTSNGKTWSRRGGTTSGLTAAPSPRPGSSSHATTQTSLARYQIAQESEGARWTSYVECSLFIILRVYTYSLFPSRWIAVRARRWRVLLTKNQGPDLLLSPRQATLIFVPLSLGPGRGWKF